VKTIFLQGELEEKIYMKQPKWLFIKVKQNKEYLLKKSFYGLKQSPRK